MTVGIIGAGPAGCFFGSKLEWDKALIFDKKPKVGDPIQCTGIVTNSILRNIDYIPDDIIVNHVDTHRIISPDGKTVDIKLDKTDIILDRAGFDRHIASLAHDVPFHMKHELTGWKKKAGAYRLFFSNGKYYDVDYIVGADGPFSKVAKDAGIYGNREILTGFQARVRIRNKDQRFEKNVAQILFNLGEFAWICPENSTTARVGIIGKDSPGFNLKKEYEKLISPYIKLQNQSGMIPMYNPKQVMQKDNIALIGDAATQVKSTSYGGIIYGMIAGSYLGKEWERYEQKWRSKLGKDLWISLKIRQALNKFSDKECEDLVRIFEKDENKQFLQKGDRNFPSRFILKLLMKETKLWKYGFKLF